MNLPYLTLKYPRSPESDTTIPTTPIKNTPIPSSTPLHHNTNSSTHNTETYAGKHKHTIKTITPNTEIPKRVPNKPLKTTNTPLPDNVSYTTKIGHILKGGKKGTKSYYYI